MSLYKTRKTWESLLLTYPTVWLSHCLVQDKQLELAHARGYYTKPFHCRHAGTATAIQPAQFELNGYNTPNADVTVAHLLDMEFARFYGRR